MQARAKLYPLRFGYRVLHYKADFACAYIIGQLGQGQSAVQNTSAYIPVGGKLLFKAAKQRGFPAAGFAAN
jgi:hypothetical protein